MVVASFPTGVEDRSVSGGLLRAQKENALVLQSVWLTLIPKADLH